MKKIIIVCLLFLAVGSYKAQAQIGIAVAKKNGSVVEWRISWNEGTAWDCQMAARKYLLDKDHEQVYTQEGDECCGHAIIEGYWVIAKGRSKNANGDYITEYGLGASSSSYEEAEARAVKNLSLYALSWIKTDGYTVDRKGEF